DVAAVDDVRALFGKPVEAFVAGGSAVVDAINRVYERADQGGGELQGERNEESQDELEDILDSDDEAPIIR
ncbi:MAG TPA: type II secretion system protein GspE, partial [Polyangiaceae bacterium]|nr:type II secretion system protein GspE [Polyangiaceae bacterium]